MQPEWIEKLLKLQDIDLRIIKLRRQIEAVPEEKKQAEKELRENEENLEKAKQAVADNEKAIKKVESDIESLKAKERDFAAKSTMIKDNQEYRAALHQIEECKNKVSSLEDKELELMESLETARAQLEKEKKEYDAAAKRTRQMVDDLDLRARNCQERIAKFESEREAYRQAVPADKLNRYDRILQSPPGRAGRPPLVPVGRNNMCGGCRMNVPAQARIDAANGALSTCPNCGVMLYYDENAH